LARTSRSTASLLAPGELSAFARACMAVANETADQEGFVSVRSLLMRFQARLIIRPLLVEGMLAAIEPTDFATGASRWAVLVDSETYAVTELEVSQESAASPLPSRLRFTVAHELAHSLAFRPMEFGIRLRNPIDSDESKKDLVEAIERATDRLGPLLLLPEKVLTNLFDGRKQLPSVDELARFRSRAGVSRQVFINRLRLLSYTDAKGVRSRGVLNNVGICVGEWVDSKNARLRSWPIFTNFERNIVPTFLMALSDNDFLPARTIFADESFSLCGGECRETDLIVTSGIPGVPKAEQMTIRCSVEHTKRIAGRSFLVIVQKSELNIP
jgi:hypothetical protein